MILIILNIFKSDSELEYICLNAFRGLTNLQVQHSLHTVGLWHLILGNKF